MVLFKRGILLVTTFSGALLPLDSVRAPGQLRKLTEGLLIIWTCLYGRQIGGHGESWTISNIWSLMSARSTAPIASSRILISWQNESLDEDHPCGDHSRLRESWLQPLQGQTYSEDSKWPTFPGRGSLWRRAFDTREWGWQSQDPSMKNKEGGASLVAQWLRICLLMQGTRVRALVWEDPTCRGATGPVSHNCWAYASGACAPQREGPR